MARFENQNAGPWYSHAVYIAFSVEYPAKSSDDISPTELHRALMKRARGLPVIWMRWWKPAGHLMTVIRWG